jgi:hypothetical protein
LGRGRRDVAGRDRRPHPVDAPATTTPASRGRGGPAAGLRP